MSVVTYMDVGLSLGRPITDDNEQAQVSQWIDDAELLIEARLGDVSLLNQDRLKYVVREAVVARLRNPEGYSSESIDDYTYRMPAESRRVTILPEWWNMLDPNSGSGAFSARPYFETDTSMLPSLDWS